MPIWKDTKEFPSNFEVSECGLVRNKKTGNTLNRTVEFRGRKRKDGEPNNHAPIVVMSVSGHKFKRSVGKLMADAFIPNPYNLTNISYVNGDNTNLTLENIRWVGDAMVKHCYINQFTSALGPLNIKDSNYVPIAAEHLVCADVLLQGFMAVCDVFPSAPYDVLVDAEQGRFLRIQVKSKRTFPQKGSIKFSRNEGWDRYVGNVDVFAFVILKVGVIFYVPAAPIINTGFHMPIDKLIAAAPTSLTATISSLYGDENG